LSHDVNPPERGERVRRNDQRISDAARQVLGADPRASMADIAAFANVGMSALYRRYPSKQALVASLVDETRASYQTELARTAERLTAGDAPWDVYADFLRALVDANAHFTHPGTPQIAELLERDVAVWDAITDQNHALFSSTQAAGVFRPGLAFVDIGLLLGAVSAVRGVDPQRSLELRRRLLHVILDGLRAELPPLTGDPPTATDYRTP
jgi:AcrR family transcriptional regulator